MTRYALVTSAVLISSQPFVSAEDADAVAKEIRELRELFEQGVGKNNDRALSAIRTAMASPKAAYEFYMDSKKKVDFDDAGKSGSDWREWRERNEERYKEPAHLKARQFQLRYLALSIGATAAGDDPARQAEMVPEVLSYLDDLTASAGEIAAHRSVLDAPVINSTYAKRMKLDLTLDRAANWCYTPLDVSEIYDSTILPAARETGEVSKISSAWDRRIGHEAKVATLPAAGIAGAVPDIAGINREDVEDLISRFRGRGRDRDAERDERREAERRRGQGEEWFREERLPELKWGKARDELVFGGDRADGLRGMMTIFKANLNHPRARAWLDELTALSEKTDDSKDDVEGK